MSCLPVSPQDAAFFDHNNPVGLAERERAFQLALADMMAYLRSESGQVAIFDATNSTQDRREKLVSVEGWKGGLSGGCNEGGCTTRFGDAVLQECAVKC
jgi:hypothetical protein